MLSTKKTQERLETAVVSAGCHCDKSQYICPFVIATKADFEKQVSGLEEEDYKHTLVYGYKSFGGDTKDRD